MSAKAVQATWNTIYDGPSLNIEVRLPLRLTQTVKTLFAVR